jgi:hypothetical protein
MRKLCESISDLGKIAILTHAQSQKSAADRYKGFAEEIAEHPKVSVVANLEENSEESIETMVESTLDVTPELDGIICTNESTTEKVLEVLSIMNRTDIRVVGFDLGEAQADPPSAQDPNTERWRKTRAAWGTRPSSRRFGHPRDRRSTRRLTPATVGLTQIPLICRETRRICTKWKETV